MQDEKIIVAAIGAVSGLLPIMATRIVQWFERRDALHRQRQLLDTSYRQVEFLKLWVETQALVAGETDLIDAKRSAAAQLKEIRGVIANQAADTERLIAKQEEQVKGPAKRRRTLLQRTFLAYFPRTTAGWALHLLYYMAVGSYLFFVSAMFWDAITSGREDWIIEAVVGFILIVPVVILIILWLPATLIDTRSRTVDNTDTRTESGNSSSAE